MDRRQFVTASGALLATGPLVGAAGALAVTTPARAADEPARPLPPVEPLQQYRIGYTTNTRGGWESEPFKGMAEAREVGFRYVEIFGTSFCRPDSLYYPNDAEGLMRRIFQLGVNFVAITGGAAGGATQFEDPAARSAVIDNHLAMARFSRKFGCVHQKTNLGKRRPGGTTDEDLTNMARTVELLGRRMMEELGMPLGLHPHLGSQLQNEHEVNFLMDNTDPQYVKLVLDTGHIQMAGMDPIALGKKLGSRVIEYHLKDTAPKDRGGAKVVPGPDVDMVKNPYFFPVGTGGVDFVALKAHLDSIRWRGFLTVELDTSPWRPPKESARMSADYIQNVLKIPL
jgi:inosose dehydratase